MGIFKTNRDLRQENDDLLKRIEELEIHNAQLQHENSVYKARKDYVEGLIVKNEQLHDDWRQQIAAANKAKSNYETLHKNLLKQSVHK